MKSFAISVPGSVITAETAPGYYRRQCERVYKRLTMESSIFLSDIENRIINAGFMTWAEIEAVEDEVLKNGKDL